MLSSLCQWVLSITVVGDVVMDYYRFLLANMTILGDSASGSLERPVPCLLAFSPFPLRKMRNRKLWRLNSYFRSSLEETFYLDTSTHQHSPSCLSEKVWVSARGAGVWGDYSSRWNPAAAPQERVLWETLSLNRSLTSEFVVEGDCHRCCCMSRHLGLAQGGEAG